MRLLKAARPHIRLPVPDLTLHEGPPVFSLHAKLRGGRLERDDYLRLDDAQRRRLASDLAGFFADLHALPVETMRAAGAEPVEWWDVRPSTLEPVWANLPEGVRRLAEHALAAYREPGVDARTDVYGFFDGHGWNMAFDHAAGRLNGIYDFADSGLGPREREFVHVSLTHVELAWLTVDAYEAETGFVIDRRLVARFIAAQRLSEYAGALALDDGAEMWRDALVRWFEEAPRFGWQVEG